LIRFDPFFEQKTLKKTAKLFKHSTFLFLFFVFLRKGHVQAVRHFWKVFSITRLWYFANIVHIRAGHMGGSGPFFEQKTLKKNSKNCSNYQKWPWAVLAKLLVERCLFTNDVKTKELLTSRAYES